MANVKPIKNLGYTIENINKALDFFKSQPLPNEQEIKGPDQDDADSIISSAALRFFSEKDAVWQVPKQVKKRRMDIWCSIKYYLCII